MHDVFILSVLRGTCVHRCPRAHDSASQYHKIIFLTIQSQSYILNHTGTKHNNNWRSLYSNSDTKWKIISMNFLGPLPETKTMLTCIMIVIRKLSKMIRIMPTRHDTTDFEIANLFKIHVYSHHGVPDKIISGRDKIFMRNLERSNKIDSVRTTIFLRDFLLPLLCRFTQTNHIPTG